MVDAGVEEAAAPSSPRTRSHLLRQGVSGRRGGSRRAELHCILVDAEVEEAAAHSVLPALSGSKPEMRRQPPRRAPPHFGRRRSQGGSRAELAAHSVSPASSVMCVRVQFFYIFFVFFSSLRCVYY